MSTSAPKHILLLGSGERCGVPLDLLFLGEFILEAESLLEQGSVPQCSAGAASRAVSVAGVSNISPLPESKGESAYTAALELIILS